jgi:hypothetical protein
VLSSTSTSTFLQRIGTRMKELQHLECAPRNVRAVGQYKVNFEEAVMEEVGHTRHAG